MRIFNILRSTLNVILITYSVFILNVSAKPNNSSESHELRHYDEKNRYAGKSVKRGDEVRDFDKYGRYKGKKIIKNNEIRRYDKHGKLIGKTTK